MTEIRTLLNEARNVDNTQKNVYWLSDKAVAYLQVELELYAGNYPAVLELTKDLETEYPESVLGADVYKYLWSSENSDARIFGKYQLEQIYMDIRFDTFEKGDYLVLSQNVDYEEEDIRKGIGDVMGGKVLELESERLKAEGRTEGEAIGQARGEAIGQIQGETRLGSLITRLLQDQRTEEIPIVSTDAKRREQLYKEYNL